MSGELRAVELSVERWEAHLTSVRRGLVLLARLANGETIKPEDVPMILASRARLREVGDLIEAAIEAD